jgi:hypothetical protein
MAVAVAIFFHAGAGLQRRFARNYKSMPNRTVFSRWFRMVSVAFCPRCLMTFSIQHSIQTRLSRFSSLNYADFCRKRLNSFKLGLSAAAFEDCKHQKTDAH